MFKNKLILLFATFFLLHGCGYKQISTQSRDIAYLKFSKAGSKQFTVKINNRFNFTLDRCIKKDGEVECINSIEHKLYEVSSGNIDIQVFSEEGNLVLQKNGYIGSSSTMEINLP